MGMATKAAERGVRLMDRDAEIAAAIRIEIAKVVHLVQMGAHPRGSLEDVALSHEIIGLRRALALVDPNFYK